MFWRRCDLSWKAKPPSNQPEPCDPDLFIHAHADVNDVSPAHTRNSRHPVARGTWGQKNSRRISPVTKLGRRNSSRQCCVCSASARAVDGVSRQC